MNKIPINNLLKLTNISSSQINFTQIPLNQCSLSNKLLRLNSPNFSSLYKKVSFNFSTNVNKPPANSS